MSKTVWSTIGVCLGLVGLVWLVFGETLHHEFVNFDDETYVYRNPVVMRGVSIEGAKWAFTHVVAANWHPLTILSHMLDCQLYGIAPAGHHFTNLFLHSVAAILLFLVLKSMTGAMWRSAFVAAVFAIHPLHVESVAWVAERKDVLSAVFFLLTIGAYLHYIHKPTAARYFLILILFACGLMAKPMLITLPFVFLVLDYWPLNRAANPTNGRPTWKRLIVEKFPLVTLAFVAMFTALATQHQSTNLIRGLSLAQRIGNAFVSLMVYIGQTIWPTNLAVFYPHPVRSLLSRQVVMSMLAIGAISVTAILFRKTMPYLFTGWFWFAGMLVPVLGLVQVGIQAHADRYTYLPQIGLTVTVAWAVAKLLGNDKLRRWIASLLAVAVLAPLIWCARAQASHWRDSESLWQHALLVTADNENAREHLAEAQLDKGKINEAVEQARRAVDLEPDSADAHATLGAALARKGNLDEAAAQLRLALESNPRLTQAHYNLGNVLMAQDRVDEAILDFEAELKLNPNFPEAHNNLANALFRKGDVDTAMVHLQRALELNPNYAQAHSNFGIALSQKGDIRRAIAEWKTALQLEPDNLDAQCNLAWVLATFPDASIRDGGKAVELAQKALHLSGGNNARIWRLTAAAYAETGDFADAIKAAQNAVALAEAQGNTSLAAALQMNIQHFQEKTPIRDVH